MRLLKAQNTNLRSIGGKGVKYDINEQVIADSTNSILVPKGTTAERSSSPVSGQFRYNTTDNRFEVYEAGAWVGVRAAAPSTSAPILQQNLGNGDATIVLFGPLDNGDPFNPTPAGAVNLLVLVENVFQVSTTNYTLVQNPSSTTTGQEVSSGNFVTATEYIITATGSTDFVSEHSAADNNPGTTFTAASAGTVDATGLARPTGYYLNFTSAPDAGKPVTVIHNFDK